MSEIEELLTSLIRCYDVMNKPDNNDVNFFATRQKILSRFTELERELSEAKKETYPAYKREKEIRCQLESEAADLRKQVEQASKAVEAMESIISWNKDHAANRLYDSMFISAIQGPINAYQQSKESAKEEGK